jgi:hypothetical protein
VALGWCIAATSLVPIPLMAAVQIAKAKSNRLIGVSRHFFTYLVLVISELLLEYEYLLQSVCETIGS